MENTLKYLLNPTGSLTPCQPGYELDVNGECLPCRQGPSFNMSIPSGRDGLGCVDSYASANACIADGCELAGGDCILISGLWCCQFPDSGGGTPSTPVLARSLSCWTMSMAYDEAITYNNAGNIIDYIRIRTVQYNNISSTVSATEPGTIVNLPWYHYENGLTLNIYADQYSRLRATYSPGSTTVIISEAQELVADIGAFNALRANIDSAGLYIFGIGFQRNTKIVSVGSVTSGTITVTIDKPVLNLSLFNVNGTMPGFLGSTRSIAIGQDPRKTVIVLSTPHAVANNGITLTAGGSTISSDIRQRPAFVRASTSTVIDLSSSPNLNNFDLTKARVPTDPDYFDRVAVDPVNYANAGLKQQQAGNNSAGQFFTIQRCETTTLSVIDPKLLYQDHSILFAKNRPASFVGTITAANPNQLVLYNVDPNNIINPYITSLITGNLQTTATVLCDTPNILQPNTKVLSYVLTGNKCIFTLSTNAINPTSGTGNQPGSPTFFTLYGICQVFPGDTNTTYKTPITNLEPQRAIIYDPNISITLEVLPYTSGVTELTLVSSFDGELEGVRILGAAGIDTSTTRIIRRRGNRLFLSQTTTGSATGTVTIGVQRAYNINTYIKSLPLVAYQPATTYDQLVFAGMPSPSGSGNTTQGISSAWSINEPVANTIDDETYIFNSAYSTALNSFSVRLNRKLLTVPPAGKIYTFAYVAASPYGSSPWRLVVEPIDQAGLPCSIADSDPTATASLTVGTNSAWNSAQLTLNVTSTGMALPTSSQNWTWILRLFTGTPGSGTPVAGQQNIVGTPAGTGAPQTRNWTFSGLSPSTQYYAEVTVTNASSPTPKFIIVTTNQITTAAVPITAQFNISGTDYSGFITGSTFSQPTFYESTPTPIGQNAILKARVITDPLPSPSYTESGIVYSRSNLSTLNSSYSDLPTTFSGNDVINIQNTLNGGAIDNSNRNIQVQTFSINGVGSVNASNLNIILLNTPNLNIKPGFSVSGPGIAGGTRVVSVNLAGDQITINNNSIVNSNITYTFNALLPGTTYNWRPWVRRAGQQFEFGSQLNGTFTTAIETVINETPPDPANITGTVSIGNLENIDFPTPGEVSKARTEGAGSNVRHYATVIDGENASNQYYKLTATITNYGNSHNWRIERISGIGQNWQQIAQSVNGIITSIPSFTGVISEENPSVINLGQARNKTVTLKFIPREIGYYRITIFGNHGVTYLANSIPTLVIGNTFSKSAELITGRPFNQISFSPFDYTFAGSQWVKQGTPYQSQVNLSRRFTIQSQATSGSATITINKSIAGANQLTQGVSVISSRFPANTIIQSVTFNPSTVTINLNNQATDTSPSLEDFTFIFPTNVWLPTLDPQLNSLDIEPTPVGTGNPDIIKNGSTSNNFTILFPFNGENGFKSYSVNLKATKNFPFYERASTLIDSIETSPLLLLSGRGPAPIAKFADLSVFFPTELLQDEDQVVASSSLYAETFRIISPINFPMEQGEPPAKTIIPSFIIRCEGIAFTGFASYTNISQSSIIGSGSGAKFDIVRVDKIYTVFVKDTGQDYQIGDILTINGSVLGGTDGVNNLTITVLGINGFDIVGSGIATAGDAEYTNVSGSTAGSGTGAKFNISKSGGQYKNVRVINPGEGYHLDDEITFAAGDLDSVNPLTIKLKSIDWAVTNTSAEFKAMPVGLYPITLVAQNFSFDPTIPVYDAISRNLLVTGAIPTMFEIPLVRVPRNLPEDIIVKDFFDLNGSTFSEIIISKLPTHGKISIEPRLKASGISLATSVAATGTDSYFSVGQDRSTGSGTGAKFNIERDGGLYQVTIIDGGINYKAGEVITILGSKLGGIDVVNDLKIIVTSAVRLTELDQYKIEYMPNENYIGSDVIGFKVKTTDGKISREGLIEISVEPPSLLVGDNNQTIRFVSSITGSRETKQVTLQNTGNTRIKIYGIELVQIGDDFILGNQVSQRAIFTAGSQNINLTQINNSIQLNMQVTGTGIPDDGVLEFIQILGTSVNPPSGGIGSIKNISGPLPITNSTQTLFLDLESSCNSCTGNGATFNVKFRLNKYEVEIASPGQNYEVGDIITIPIQPLGIDVTFEVEKLAPTLVQNVNSITEGTGSGAKFNVIIDQPNYIATVVIPGNNYSIGDLIRINGNLLYGQTGINDLVLRVTETATKPTLVTAKSPSTAELSQPMILTSPSTGAPLNFLSFYSDITLLPGESTQIDLSSIPQTIGVRSGRLKIETN